MPATVATLRSSPVKGLAQDPVGELTLEADGVREDRRFAIVDPDGHARYTPELRPLAGARARWDADGGALELRFRDGERVEGPVVLAEPVAAHGYGRRPMPGHRVEGPFAAALSARLGAPVRLVHLPVGVGSPGPVTLLSLASLPPLAGRLGAGALDPRRFKMTVELDGVPAHAEDGWAGREVRIGAARLRVGGPVPRCVLTTLDPDRLVRDLDTMRAILAHRGPMASGEPPFGVYADVLQPGRIAVGDAVVPADPEGRA